MSLVFAAVTAHPPALIPAIGKEAGLAALAQTKAALERLEQELYLVKPEMLLIISPHEGLFQDAFVVNAHTAYRSNFEEFGDLATKVTWKGTPDTASKISHVANNETSLPVRLVSEEKLSHGASVPLFYLTAHNPDIKVLPIGFSALPPDQHLAFGELLKDVIMRSDKRIAVVASGDLSHCLSEDAPAGYNPAGEAFDNGLISALERFDVDSISGVDPAAVAAVQECGYRSLLILLGIIRRINCRFETYAYEHPFGVGYLTGNFVLS